MTYRPLTGAACSCKRGVQRDNCPNCEGTGRVIDFGAIHRAREQREALAAKGKELGYPQRDAYMAGSVSFAEFYGSVATVAGISYENSPHLDRIKAALETDEHLNNIPLAWWDRRAAATQGVVSRALKMHGDFYSLAGGVCVHKAAARKAAKEVKP